MYFASANPVTGLCFYWRYIPQVLCFCKSRPWTMFYWRYIPHVLCFCKSRPWTMFIHSKNPFEPLILIIKLRHMLTHLHTLELVLLKRCFHLARPSSWRRTFAKLKYASAWNSVGSYVNLKDNQLETVDVQLRCSKKRAGSRNEACVGRLVAVTHV